MMAVAVVRKMTTGEKEIDLFEQHVVDWLLLASPCYYKKIVEGY